MGIELTESQQKILSEFKDTSVKFWKDKGADLIQLPEDKKLDAYAQSLKLTLKTRMSLIIDGLEPKDADKAVGKTIGKITTDLREELNVKRAFILPPGTFERYKLDQPREEIMQMLNIQPVKNPERAAELVPA